MDTNTLVRTFNSQFYEFIGDIQRTYPEDVDILTAQNALESMRKINPKLIANYWYHHIYLQYKAQIEGEDISFFLTKDYSDDLQKSKNSDKIMTAIDRLREPFRNMDQNKMLSYIKKLSKISILIFSSSSSTSSSV